MLKSLIQENEDKIESFNLKYYEQNQNYPVLAAICALETTNEIQKSYFKEEDKDLGFNVLKLYAFLQSLFVSIDSLYALAYSLTKSKNIININKNPILRELKYIRNDVVGHPANRVYDSQIIAYCILDAKSVTKTSFSYDVISKAGTSRKDVDIFSIVENYYKECNELLKELKSTSEETIQGSIYETRLREALTLFDMQGEYMSCIQRLKETYKKDYPNSSSNQNRFLWRLELIDELSVFHSEDQDIMDLVEYAIGLEIVKLYQLVTEHKDVVVRRKKPFLVTSFYRFLKKNKESLKHIEKIYDIKNPLIVDALHQLLSLAKDKNAKGVVRYLNLLMELYEKKMDSLLYALALPIKEFKS